MAIAWYRHWDDFIFQLNYTEKGKNIKLWVQQHSTGLPVIFKKSFKFPCNVQNIVYKTFVRENETKEKTEKILLRNFQKQNEQQPCWPTAAAGIPLCSMEEKWLWPSPAVWQLCSNLTAVWLILFRFSAALSLTRKTVPSMISLNAK